jgi:outer membrane protein assembly factor BamB
MKKLVIAFAIFLPMIGSAQKTTTYVAHFREQFRGPKAYRDPSSGIVLYLESDGRHMAAISREGKLLWHRDLFKDAHLPYYRFNNPQVVYLGSDNGSIAGTVGISLANSQFGLLTIKTGDFRFQGQD